MKKILTIACAALFTFGAFAQDVNQATDLYNYGANALTDGNRADALNYFQQALAIAKDCGADGEELVANCQSVIPQLYIYIAKDFIKAGAYEDAVAKLTEGIDVCNEMGDEDKAREAANLIPQVYMQQGGALLKVKDYDAAAEIYSKVLEIAPDNGRAALMLGQAKEKAGDVDAAEQAYVLATTLGQEKTANKQLSNLFLKKSVALLQAKDYAAAQEAAEKSFTYNENQNAYRVAGQAAMNLEDKTTAIQYFEKFLELAPADANAPQIREAVAILQKQLAAPAAK